MLYVRCIQILQFILELKSVSLRTDFWLAIKSSFVPLLCDSSSSSYRQHGKQFGLCSLSKVYKAFKCKAEDLIYSLFY